MNLVRQSTLAQQKSLQVAPSINLEPMTCIKLACAGVLGVALMGLSSCNPPAIGQASQPITTPTATTSPLPIPTASASTSPEPFSTSEPSAATPDSPEPEQPAKTTTVTVYKIDNQCDKFVAEQVKVIANQPINGAVGNVINAQSNGDFKLSGYRVNVSRNGVATIDLRLAATSRRKIVSLSTCEQLALFGSLRETLTKNPQWKVRSVRFTERGERIVL